MLLLREYRIYHAKRFAPIYLYFSLPVHPDDRLHVADTFTTLLKDGQHQELEFRILLPDAKQKWIRVNAYTSQNNNKETILGIAVDITREKDYSDTFHKFSGKKNSILQILS